MKKGEPITLWVILDYTEGNPSGRLYYKIFPNGQTPGEGWAVIDDNKATMATLVQVTVESKKIPRIRQLLTDPTSKTLFGIKNSGVVGKNGEYTAWPKMGCS